MDLLVVALAVQRSALHDGLVQDLQAPADAHRAEGFGGLAGQVGAVHGGAAEAAATAEGLGVLRVRLLDAAPQRQVVLAHLPAPIAVAVLALPAARSRRPSGHHPCRRLLPLQPCQRVGITSDGPPERLLLALDLPAAQFRSALGDPVGIALVITGTFVAVDQQFVAHCSSPCQCRYAAARYMCSASSAVISSSMPPAHPALIASISGKGLSAAASAWPSACTSNRARTASL